MYYHQVGETINSYSRMVFQNEMLAGQAQDYLTDLMEREGEKPMAFDPSDFYICLTGLPKRVSTGRYHQSANDNMVYYIQLERILQKRFEELNGSGEVILHLYGDKQIVVLFSVWEGTIQERNERAQQIAQTACEELERMYEQTYLKDGAYANVTLLSERLCSWSQIGEQMRRMTERWNRCFFRMKAKAWLPQIWDADMQHPSSASLSEEKHRLQQVVANGDSDRAQMCIEHIFLDLIRPGYDDYMLNDMLSWLKSRYIQFAGAYGGTEMTDNEIDLLFDARLYPNINLLTDKLKLVFGELAELADANDRRYGMLTQRAMRLIREQAMVRDMSLTYVSERLGVSSAYLSSVFKREAGVSLTQYITEIRIAQAKKLLQETGMTVEQIAQRVGFGGKRYFCTVFKRETGMTPQTCRIAARK